MSHLSRALNQFDEARASAALCARLFPSGLVSLLQVLDGSLMARLQAGRNWVDRYSHGADWEPNLRPALRFAGNYMPLLERHTESA